METGKLAQPPIRLSHNQEQEGVLIIVLIVVSPVIYLETTKHQGATVVKMWYATIVARLVILVSTTMLPKEETMVKKDRSD